MDNKNNTDIVTRGFVRNVSLSYKNKKYVADEIFPVVKGTSASKKIHRDSKADIYRSEAGVRAPGTAAPVAQVRGGTQNLNPVNYSVARAVTDELRRESRAQGNFNLAPDAKAVSYIADQIAMKKEIDFFKLIHSAVWSGIAAGGEDAEGHWGDSTEASDTMMEDIKKAEGIMMAAGCPKPNLLTLSNPAWLKICISPYWLTKLNNTQFGLVSPEMMATTLSYKIIISEAITNVDPEKSQDIDTIASKYIMAPNVADNLKGHAFLSYSPAVAEEDMISAGLQYRIRNEEQGDDLAMSQWREPDKHQDKYDGEMNYDIVRISGECGYLWKDTALT